MAGGMHLRVPVDGNEYQVWPTAEALYQACRFPEWPDIQKEIMEERSPMKAKWLARKFLKKTRNDWDEIKVQIMWWCLGLKAVQWPDRFAESLLRTGRRPIVEVSRRDRYWGAIEQCRKLIGMNMLGKLLMHLRDQLRQYIHDGRLLQVRISAPDVKDFVILGKQVDSYITDMKSKWTKWQVRWVLVEAALVDMVLSNHSQIRANGGRRSPDSVRDAVFSLARYDYPFARLLDRMGTEPPVELDDAVVRLEELHALSCEQLEARWWFLRDKLVDLCETLCLAARAQDGGV